MSRTTFLALILLLPTYTASEQLDREAPPPAGPDLHVIIAYRIDAPSAQRAEQFARMLAYLQDVGFKPAATVEEEATDPEGTRLSGNIGQARARRILDEPHVRSVLLTPPAFRLPDNPATPVKVSLELAPAQGQRTQAVLAQQAVAQLRRLGFREAIGYDHRAHTRLLGWIEAGELETLLKDLRGQPAGWLAPDDSFSRLPSPLGRVFPIRLTEVLPGGAAPLLPQAPAAKISGQEPIWKISAGLQQRMRTPDRVERFEMILRRPLDLNDTAWRDELRLAAPALEIEGLLGPVVTVRAPAGSALALAALRFVSVVRLPRPASVHVQSVPAAADLRPLLRSDSAHLAELSHRGRGVRFAVVDADFRGWERFRGTRLPPSTRILDITAQEDPDLQPAPNVETTDIGRGTYCALALALAAPEGDLTLVRIDPAAPYQLQEVSRAINGEGARAEALDRRREQLEAQDHRLRSQQGAHDAQRREVDEDFSQDEAAVRRRIAFREAEARLTADRRAHNDRAERLVRLEAGLLGLRGIRIVSSSLIWEDSYPVTSTSPLSQYFNLRPFRAALWWQAAGDTGEQVWTGLFRDEDSNGVMEFAPPGTTPPARRWTTELDFLGWQPEAGSRSPEIPSQTRLHLSVQWTEAHDPTLFADSNDPYRQPLANLRIVLLRQRDPLGRDSGSDEMDLVAGSQGVPERLEFTPHSATYEISLDVAVPTTARYAVRLEGRVPTGIRPPSAASLPTLGKSWELKPRLLIDSAAEAGRQTGRPVLLDYQGEVSPLGTPADSASVLTVAAASASGNPRSYSPHLPRSEPGGQTKPEVLMIDGTVTRGTTGQGVGGSAIATASAAGVAGATYSAGLTPPSIIEAARRKPARLLTLP